MSTIHYSKTSYSFIIIGGMLLGVIGIGISYYFKWGTSPIPLIVSLIVQLFFIGIILLMYRLKITIDNTHITVTLGIGLIKNSILIKDIVMSDVKKVSIPWYYGIGIRLTPYGMLYNVKVGMALLIPSKNKGRTLLVGTNDTDLLMKILFKLTNPNISKNFS
ncbi:MAG: hypothetical protein COB98_11900 [Flavobacteriaceae bacterium]|nr:MAG: hypothetical protein COB98_11900 [Flavobacteriaceae bacterium]